MVATLGRDFLYFRFGQLLALVGGRCSFIALSWWVLERSGSTEQFSRIMFVFATVGLVATPLLSPLADRWSRKACAMASDGWALAVMLALLAMVHCDIYRPLAITLLVAAFAMGGAMMNSISASIVPMLVPRERLVEAFGLLGALQSLALIFGALFAGAAIKGVGMAATLLLNAALLAVTLACTLCIRADTSPPQGRARDTGESWLSGVAGGARLYLALRLEFLWSALGGIMNACLTPFIMLTMPVFVREELHLSIGWYAILNACVAAGLFLGSFAIVRWLNHWFSPAAVTVSGVLMLGLGIVSFGIVRSPYVLALIALFIGIGMGMHNVNCAAYRTIAVPGRYRARISAWSKWLSQGLTPLGIVVFGAILARFGSGAALLVAGVVMLLIAPALALLPGFAALMGAPVGARENFYATLYPTAFAEVKTA